MACRSGERIERIYQVITTYEQTMCRQNDDVHNPSANWSTFTRMSIEKDKTSPQTEGILFGDIDPLHPPTLKNKKRRKKAGEDLVINLEVYEMARDLSGLFSF